MLQIQIKERNISDGRNRRREKLQTMNNSSDISHNILLALNMRMEERDTIVTS